MGRRSPALVAAFLVGLVLAGSALADAGVSPEPPHSPNAHRIVDSYWIVLGVSAGIFVLVEGALLLFIVKYRRRGRERLAEGPQIRGHTRLEIIWTVIPVVIIAGIVTFVFYKLPGIQDVPRANAAGGRLHVDVKAHQFYWQFDYPNGAVSIDELRAPVGRIVDLDIRGYDVDHSWWIPELGGKFDAIPGQTNHTWFTADRIGSFRGQCGEFCGIFHAQMTARVRITSAADFQRWVTTEAKANLGRSEFRNACGKCHGVAGDGGYGPRIKTNAVLSQQRGLYALIENGQDTQTPGVMPPVARGWSDTQKRALFDYVSKQVFKGPQSGG